MITKNIAPGIGQEWSEQGAKSAGDAVSAPLIDDHIAPKPPACPTCNDRGMIGGPSYYAPDEGGEPCPDCAVTAQQQEKA